MRMYFTQEPSYCILAYNSQFFCLHYLDCYWTLCLFGIRQSHKSFFQKSDLFFVCMLQPQSFEIQSQASEIEATKVSL